MNKSLQEAISIIEAGNHELGLEKLNEISRIGSDEEKRTISEIYYELGLIDRALILLEDLMFTYPDHGELFVFAAECYSEMGKEEEAIEMLLEIKKGDQAFVQAQLLLADIYQSQGLDEVAEQKLLLATEITPNEPILQFGLGEFYLNRGDYSKSIPYFKKVIHQGDLLKDESLHINPYLRLAEAYSTTGEFEEAITYYEQGLSHKEDLDGLFGYGYTALQVEDYETSVKQLTKLKELDPNYTTLYPYLAIALRSLNRLEEAFTTLREGIKKDEYNEDLYLEMAKAQFSAGNMDEGKEYLQKVIAINPSNITAIKELLLFFHQSEDYEGVLELLSFLDEYGEYDPLFERYKAKALYEEDDLENAVKAYEIAVNEFSEDDEVLEEAALAFLEVGAREKGIAIYEKLLLLHPDRYDIEERLQQLK
ncbi:tetratricopeptide repeat protein [Evansella sp. AB-rgal1]|uniref:tetratricopeptide repeat protein n=1 Tax=Evansella sp. AB-rgal1 TaxID=3242696 RepID=UPI00359D7DA1